MEDIKTTFGKLLKKQVDSKESVEKIGSWAFTFYWEHLEQLENEFQNVLLTLNAMELGPEFAFSYEELEKIADDLIAGKAVKL